MYSKIDKVQNKKQWRNKTNNGNTSKRKQQCGYCGKAVNKTRDECPARRSECSVCKKVGHWAACCRRNQKSAKGSMAMSQIRVLDVVGKKQQRRAPHIKVNIHPNAEDSFIATAKATPDTGAEATIAGLDFLKQIKIEVGNTCTPPEDTIISANGTAIDCIGTVDIYIHTADRSVKETVLICKDQQGILLAWYVCRDLGIIPSDYPKPICAITHTNDIRVPSKNVTGHTSVERRSQVRKELLVEFKNVFDTSDQLKEMAGEARKIHLEEHAEPFAITTTRPIPFAWRDEVKSNLDQMTRQGIIKPLGDVPTRWCHPLVIVPKSKGGVRLCGSDKAQ